MNKIIYGLLIILLSVPGLAFGEEIQLKNFREIYASYVAITQIDGKDPELRELYGQVKSGLPSKGEVGEFSSSLVLGLTKLGGLFCKKVIEREQAAELGERVFFKYVDFEHGPVQFQDFLKRKTFDHLGQLFWKRKATDEEFMSLSKHVDRLGEAGPQDPAETTKVLHILCSTYATSVAFIVK